VKKIKKIPLLSPKLLLLNLKMLFLTLIFQQKVLLLTRKGALQEVIKLEKSLEKVRKSIKH